MLPELGRYETLRKIASGGMATVYLGRVVGEGGFERLVALKVMHPHIGNDPDFVAMFLDEARLAARIRHPNVVATLDIQKTADAMFIVMDYVDGPTLQEIRKHLKARGERIPIGYVVRIALGVLNGLQEAHDLVDNDGKPLNLVHRDVSPHNILIGRDGVAKLTDFGVARAEARISSTRGGQLKGKIAYMPPEQILTEPVSRASDVYSAGVCMWEALVGKRLFRAPNDGAMVHMVLEGNTTPPSKHCDDIPPAVEQVVMQAIARNPSNRFTEALDMADALEDAARDSGIKIPKAREVGKFIKHIVAELDGSPSSQRSLTPASAPSGQSGEATSEPAGVSQPSMPSIGSGPSHPARPSHKHKPIPKPTPAAGRPPEAAKPAKPPSSEKAPAVADVSTRASPETPPPITDVSAPAPASPETPPPVADVSAPATPETPPPITDVSAAAPAEPPPPVTDVSAPAKTEQIPAKTEQIPAKTERMPAKTQRMLEATPQPAPIPFPARPPQQSRPTYERAAPDSEPPTMLMEPAPAHLQPPPPIPTVESEKLQTIPCPARPGCPVQPEAEGSQPRIVTSPTSPTLTEAIYSLQPPPSRHGVIAVGVAGLVAVAVVIAVLIGSPDDGTIPLPVPGASGSPIPVDTSGLPPVEPPDDTTDTSEPPSSAEPADSSTDTPRIRPTTSTAPTVTKPKDTQTPPPRKPPPPKATTTATATGTAFRPKGL